MGTERGELLLIVGPPAVGKMAVGRAVCARTDYRLFHNHHTIEPLLEVFGHGTEPFEVLNDEFRCRVIEEAARHGVRLVFTFVWAVDHGGDADAVRRFARPYQDAGLPVRVAELYADLGTRLARNRTEERLRHKPSKRDLEWSDDNLRSMDDLRLNTDPDRPCLADEVLADLDHLRVDTTGLSVDRSAARIVSWVQGRRRARAG